MAKIINSGGNASLHWINSLLSFFQAETITTPVKYRDQVLETKKLLTNDTSGLINTMLDFAISSALVDYTIETNNINLTEKLNKWLRGLNSDLRGKLPTGINALAKEYFRERWKGSSNLLLRTFWNKSDDFVLPTTLFFVDGEDIEAKHPNEKVITLGSEKYFIRVNKNRDDNIALPKEKNEFIFVQKPYESWGVLEPVPYLIKKGLFRNLKFFSLMSEKGEYIISRALELLLMIKKGTEKMALEGRGDMIYSAEDLTKVKEDFASLMEGKKSTKGTPTYVTNFDTEIEHLIPDYKLAINEAIYAPIERRILAGLGLIDIVSGTASTRRESLLNPKPFIAEIKQGIEDFKTLLNDILQEAVEQNKSHKKYFGDQTIKIQIHSSPVEHFMTDKIKDHIRSMYDRGTISIQTYNELVGVGHIDHKVEVSRRLAEAKEELEDLMYPHLIVNQEGISKDVPGKKPFEEDEDTPNNPENIPSDKTGPEKKNYKGSVEKELIYEEAPYKTNDVLPLTVKNLPSGAKTIWRKTFNSAYPKGEDYARKVAWSAVKRVYKKVGDKWVRKSSGEVESELSEMPLDELIELKELQILGKKEKLLDKLIKEGDSNGNI